MKIKRIILTLLVTLSLSHSRAQSHVHTDKQITDIIQEGLDKTYNFEFDAAEKKYYEVKKKYPLSPAYNLLMGINIYWKMMSENTYKDKHIEYFNQLTKTLLLAENMLKKNEGDVEGIFFSLSANSGLALYHAQNADHMKALAAAKRTYDFMKQGFELKDKFVDFYYSTGLYDYYVVQYPENHPVYRPFMFLFSDGDKIRGLKEMDYASIHGIYTQPEANLYLALAYLKYENRPELALKYIERLTKRFPSNSLYAARHIETLIFLGRFDEAEVLNIQLGKVGQKFFEMSSQLFSGLIYEKRDNKQDLAKAHYSKAISLSKSIEFPIKDYLALAYAGMARIADKKGNKAEAKAYYKKALEISYYTSITKEAEAYLD